MDELASPFSRFRSKNSENPSFFQNLQRKNAHRVLRSKLEDVLGPLPDPVFEMLKPKAEANFELAIMQYLEGVPIDPAAEPEHASKLEESQAPSTSSTIPEQEGLGKTTRQELDLTPRSGQPESATSQSGALPNRTILGEALDEDDSIDSLTRNSETGSQKEHAHDSSSQHDEAKEAPGPEVSCWVDDCRFIGSLQAEVWCTRSGRSLVQYNEKLKIDRAGTGSSNSSKQKDDYMVRFYNAEGLYFARAQEADARFMSVLIDAGVCHFDATVIYADPVLRLGSTVFVQVDCYFKRSVFSSTSSFSVDLKSSNNKKRTILDESKETREEKLVRLRQLALVSLLGRLSLVDPSSVDLKEAIIESDKPTQKASASPPPQLSNSDVNRGEKDGTEEEQELTTHQIELFYDEAESVPKNVAGEEAEPGESFGLSLFPYQKKGLAWMLDRERVVGEVDEAASETHPLWTELKWPEGDPFWVNLNSGELSLTRPTLALRSRGGILADEMGLGKTIIALALIHSAIEESRYRSTLVVAPMSLLSQWESEIQRAAKDPRKCGCLVYYGNSSSATTRNSLSDFLKKPGYDRRVVVTTYGMVSSEHKQRHLHKSGGLFNSKFDRIFLDEAHTIKNRATQTAKACFDLSGQRRWALTGTPVINRLEDLYSLVRFIGLEPWNNFIFWKSFITEQFQRPESRERAMKTVQAVVSPICLRRTKAMKDPATNRPLVELPEKQVDIKRIMFSEEERTLYSHLYARVRESVQTKVMEGTASSKYSAILALLLRLRQVCCHPLLLRHKSSNPAAEVAALSAPSAPSSSATPSPISPQAPFAKKLKREDGDQVKVPSANAANGDGINDDDSADDGLKLDLTADIETLLDKFSSTPSIEYTAETLKKLLDNPLEKEECSICSDWHTDPVLTECLHSACRDCMMSHIDYMKRRGDTAVCHICRAPIDSSKLFVVNATDKKLQPLNQGMQSSKVRALITSLRQAYAQGYGKAVVFSQFTSFLDLIEVNLKDSGFPVFRFDGSMTQAQRATAIEGFKAAKRQDSVLLLSQKAGGVGLNLVVANHAYLMDPWWNFANESQAIDRIHRMGQTDNVTVTRFIIQGSIEERMLKIQERKRVLSNLVTEEERRAENLENVRLLLDLEELRGGPSAQPILEKQ